MSWRLRWPPFTLSDTEAERGIMAQPERFFVVYGKQQNTELHKPNRTLDA